MIKRSTLAGLVLISFSLLIGGFFTRAIILSEDKGMRENLLLQTRLVAKYINFKTPLKFSANGNRLDPSDYEILKKGLIQIRSIYPKCRFIYLLGQRSDGKIFIFIDSEPLDSKDYSPPGQVYNEASENIRNVFLSGKEMVEGPVTDRWGTWVSAFVPLFDSRSGRVIAILGMDIEARNWVKTVVLRSFLPLNFFLWICALTLIFLYVQHRNELEKRQLRQSRLALQNSEAKYRGFFLNSPDAMIIIDPVSFQYLSGNPAMVKMFGLKNEEQLLAMEIGSLSSYQQPDGSVSSEKLRGMINRVLDKSPLFFEWRFRRSGGEEFPGAASLFKIELVGKTMLQLMVRDITLNKKIEEENAEHTKELEVFYNVSMGREERIIELKSEVEKLKKELGK